MENVVQSHKPIDTGVHFDVTLYPHRSMGRAGHKILARLLILPGLVVAALSMAYGVWPIIVFYVVHTAILYWMIRYHWFIGQGYETLRLTDEALEIKRVSAFGLERTESLPPHWLQVLFPDKPDRKSQLTVASHGLSTEVGAFLTVPEKQEVAMALRKALRDRRAALVHRD